MSQKPAYKRSLLSRLVRRIIVWIYRWQGWKIDGGLPKDLKKYVIAGAPHTSNWDFVFFAGATEVEGIHPNFMGKHTLFQGVMRNFMFDMGGIPVDRSSPQGMVEDLARRFRDASQLVVGITPEGTRGGVSSWKSGFARSAAAAEVPVLPAIVNYNEKMIYFQPIVSGTGSAEAILSATQAAASVGSPRSR